MYHQGTSDYKTFKEKCEYLNNVKYIESKSEFDKLWKQLLNLKKSNSLIYRGIPEAKYKLYNRAQRYYMENNIVEGGFGYEDYIETNIQYVKSLNNITIGNYLNRYNIKDNDLALLSIIQHFGIPTPLLDFTRNPFVALYFSTDSNATNTISENNKINRYSSLYYLNSDYWQIKYAFQYFFDQWTRNNEVGQIKYSDVKLIPFLLLPDNNPKFQIINNQNIINQEGLFIFTYHPHVPIPEHFQMIMDIQKSERVIPPDSKSELFSCWNINKQLNPYIRERLKNEMNITHDFLFPDINTLEKLAELNWLNIRKDNMGFQRIDFLKSIIEN